MGFPQWLHPLKSDRKLLLLVQTSYFSSREGDASPPQGGPCASRALFDAVLISASSSRTSQKGKKKQGPLQRQSKTGGSPGASPQSSLSSSRPRPRRDARGQLLRMSIIDTLVSRTTPALDELF